MLARALAPNTSANYQGKVQPSLQPTRTNIDHSGESQHAYYILPSFICTCILHTTHYPALPYKVLYVAVYAAHRHYRMH
jgi:hypothetical protein